ncbi:uncharacterized protein AB675_6014 [Cyphellophora attinorum]|uniref:Uncharacterized protein n=1 Tax=Cyphellophora attinorum TaxID=1664694 RepID=A0A0N0NJR6_9EURO|nr:uncharacterized protein AB675_6014 [Phialophora attinorum]KPI36959.1 hypothetical protein AB675_6014 [Phialophora attinorum]
MSHQRRPGGHSRRNPSVDMPKYTPLSMDADAQAAHERQRALAQISDYDSAYNSDMPTHDPPPQRTQDELNLKVLKIHNPDVVDVLSIIKYATMYEFKFEDPSNPGWVKLNIEGSLFMCQLTPGQYGEDQYSVILLNRKDIDNFTAPLLEVSNGGVKIQDPYIIISFADQAGQQKIYGVHVFSDKAEEAAELLHQHGNLMVALAAHAGVSRKNAEYEAGVGSAEDAEEASQETQIVQQPGGQDHSAEEGFPGSKSYPAVVDSQPRQPVPEPSQQGVDLMALFRGAAPQQSAQVPRQQQPQYHNNNNHAPQQRSQMPVQPQANALLNLFQNSGPQQQAPIPVQPQANALLNLFQSSGLQPR